ncbi:MAG: hypothetical protein WBN65_13610 [Gammaproteobacteria bacterium]
MQQAAMIIARLRRLLAPVLPRAWTAAVPETELGPGPLKPSGAATEIDPAAPASSWVVWEVSPLRRETPRRSSEQRER